MAHRRRLGQLAAHLVAAESHAAVIKIDSSQGLGLRSLATPRTFAPGVEELDEAVAFFAEHGARPDDCQHDFSMRVARN